MQTTNDKPEQNHILATTEIRVVRNTSYVTISDGLEQISAVYVNFAIKRTKTQPTQFTTGTVSTLFS